MRKSIILLATFAVLTAAAHAAEEFVAGELLVGFRPGSRGAQADAVRNGLGAAKLKAWSEIDAEHWHLPPGIGVAQAIRALSANPNVLYAEPNYLLQAAEVPNDPLRGDTWGMHNLGQSGGTPDADIDALEAWNVRTDASSVVVGVIDTGIDYTHPDLAANIWTNAGETGLDAQGRNKATNGIDDDGNGYVDDVHGWDFVNNDNDPIDDNHHGTHVAGTIGAVGNNGFGVAGVAWAVQLMPLKFLNAAGSGYTDAAVSAMLYAAKFVDASGRKKVRITSNSWIGAQKSKTLENAISSSGALVVAAAGNSGNSTVLYPAGYTQPNIVSVAATDRNDTLASFSNFGPWVNLAAPGVDILSTTLDHDYESLSGTSMATPHVSGVAALLMEQYPNDSIASIKARILSNVDVLPALAGKVTTSGRLNARKALGAAEFASDTIAPAAISDLASSSADLTSVTLTWTAPGDDGTTGAAYFYQVRYGTTPVTEAQFTYVDPIDIAPQNAGATETFTVGDLQIGTTYYFAVRAIDEAGNPSPISNIAAVTTLDNDWRFMNVWTSVDMANTISAVRNSSGGWTIVSDDTGNLKFFNYIYPNGYYNQETIGPISGGASVTYDAAGVLSIGYISAGKLNFAQKPSTTWSIAIVESRDILNGDTSTLFDNSGAAWITYPKGGRTPGLYAGRRVGTSWTIQTIERNGDGIYNQSALAPDGWPSVAYADDITGDGKADVLKLAHFGGASWSISVIDNVETGPVSLAFNPIDGNPVIASRSGPNNELRFYRWTGTAWASEIIDPAIPIQSCSIASATDGTLWIAYATLNDMRGARRDASTGAWTTFVIDPDGGGICRTALYIGPTSGRPLTVYGAPAPNGFERLRLAAKNTP
jgi:subtilisin family serine protease